jgi:hypothetical protein
VSFDKAVLAELTVVIDVTDYIRILWQDHRKTPTGMGFGETRFASPTRS